MQAIKDQMVHIPLTDEDIANTLSLLPRTPNEAGIVPIQLKRKLNFKNSHLKEYISVDKIKKALITLRNLGHPEYQKDFEKDWESFQNRLDIEDEKVQDDGADPKCMEVQDEIDCENIDENTEPEENEPKFEFKYDVDTCFTNDFPEMEVQDQPISVAPGEGKIPVNILDDEEWDQKTHPFLDPTGDNNLHKQRRVKITPQQFFEQRLFNAETIYGETSSFMFAAVSYHYG